MFSVFCGCIQEFDYDNSGKLVVNNYDEAITSYTNLIHKADNENLVIVQLNISVDKINGLYIIDYGVVSHQRFECARLTRLSNAVLSDHK